MRTTSYPREPASGLTRLQANVRTYLRAHSGETISRERLCREVWGIRYFNSSRTIDQTISVVRKHLEHEECILSVFGVGYRHLFRTAAASNPRPFQGANEPDPSPESKAKGDQRLTCDERRNVQNPGVP